MPMSVEAGSPAGLREGEVRTVGIAMNGVTGRMGTNQHLVRSILAIRSQGGVSTASGLTIWPEPVLVGRNEAKLRSLAERHGLERWSTDLDEALGDPGCEVYFDAAATAARGRWHGARPSRRASTCTAKSPRRPTSSRR